MGTSGAIGKRREVGAPTRATNVAALIPNCSHGLLVSCARAGVANGKAHARSAVITLRRAARSPCNIVNMRFDSVSTTADLQPVVTTSR